LADLKGEKKIQTKLKKAARVIPAEMGAALYQEGLLIMAESMRRTPVRDGFLRGSHETSEPRWKGKIISVDIKVGGPAAPYAKIVHERTYGPSGAKVFHKTGRSKFIESALLEATSGLKERIAKRIDLNRLA
tara:strand:- start:66 stop:461 length:396 start_codon:yes stop_codon:yes gene_type:complete